MLTLLSPPSSSKVKALTLFVTHYPPLCELERVYPEHVSNYHMAFLLNDADMAADTDGRCVSVYENAFWAMYLCCVYINMWVCVCGQTEKFGQSSLRSSTN